MRSPIHTFLYLTLAAAFSTNAFGQHGVGNESRNGIPLPSSTAFGAGATIAGRAAAPSSTAIGAGAPVRSSFARGGYYNNSNTSRAGYGRNNRNVPYGAFLSPYYYPSLGYGYGGGAPYGGGPDDSYYDPSADPALVTQNLLGEQVQRLAAELDQMKYAQQQPVPGYAQNSEPATPVVPVTVVLRNGQKLQVQNYAIMDSTFWDFSKQPARKIPISSIDVAASSQATAANGGDFPDLDFNK